MYTNRTTVLIFKHPVHLNLVVSEYIPQSFNLCQMKEFWVLLKAYESWSWLLFANLVYQRYLCCISMDFFTL